jgi:ribokinase
VAKLGDDVLKAKLIESMRQDGVRLDYLTIDKSSSTGIALITVDRTGQNEIVVVSGSNMKLSPRNVIAHRKAFEQAKIVLLQLESPLETVEKAVQCARHSGATTILNPAPGRKLPPTLLSSIDYLTPNETEIEILAGIKIVDLASAEKAAKKLLLAGVKNVIVTLGINGSLLVTRNRVQKFSSFRVKALDATAAGDAFNGGLAFALGNGDSVDDAIRFASIVAAFSVTRIGAQSSMPTMKELHQFQEEHPK